MVVLIRVHMELLCGEFEGFQGRQGKLLYVLGTKVSGNSCAYEFVLWRIGGIRREAGNGAFCMRDRW